MRSDKKGRKKILDPNSVHTRPRQENSEKNSEKIQKIKKPFFRQYFSPKRDEKGRERVKKMLFPNFVHTRPGQENSENVSKKFKKSKNPFPAIFLAKTG